MRVASPPVLRLKVGGKRAGGFPACHYGRNEQAPPISGDRGLFVQAPPTHPPALPFGLALFFSGRAIEDDLAPENVPSWEKETCWR